MAKKRKASPTCIAGSKASFWMNNWGMKVVSQITAN
jgi:hypothetical protein